MGYRGIYVALGIVLLAGCAGVPEAAPGAPPSTVASAPASPPPPPPPPPPSRAQAAVDATAESVRSGATLGVAVLDRETGEVVGNDDADEPQRAASITKLYTIVDLLLDPAEAPLDDAETALVRRALGPSDDSAMNTLWSTRDGPAGIDRLVATLELTATDLPSDTSQWGEVTTSPRDVAVVLGAVTDRLAPADRDLVLDAMAAAPAEATDGFEQDFGLLDPERRGGAAAKQGWLCCLEGGIELHSAGLPDPDGRYAVVLLSRQPFGYPAARTLLDDAAGEARAALTAG